jgi:hypothetical protein
MAGSDPSVAVVLGTGLVFVGIAIVEFDRAD